MLESESRRLLLVTILGGLVALAPLASASAPFQEARETADGAREDAAEQVPETGTELDPLIEEALAPKSVSEHAEPVLEAEPVQGTVTLVKKTVDSVVALVPKDPVQFLDQQVAPIRETADGMLAPDAYEVEDPAPATATAEPVASSITPEMLMAGSAAAAAAILVAWLAGSSGSLGAGAAGATGAGGKVAGSEMRRLLPFASPLFTRFEKDTVLGHPKREALYALILQDPGVSLQSLCDATGLSRTAVTHHLRLLELQHLIVSKRLGRSRHYYENGGRFGRDQKEAYAVLHNARSKDVARYVRDHPGAIQKALCEALGIQPSIAHWHLRRLQDAQLVEAVRHGRTVSYFPGVGLRNLDKPVIPEPAPAAPVPEPAALLPEMPAVPLPMRFSRPASI